MMMPRATTPPPIPASTLTLYRLRWPTTSASGFGITRTIRNFPLSTDHRPRTDSVDDARDPEDDRAVYVSTRGGVAITDTTATGFTPLQRPHTGRVVDVWKEGADHV